MKVHPQIISQKGVPVFVVLPYQEYQTILDLLEDIEDVTAVMANQEDKSERFPLDLVEKIAAGGNAVKIFREYRKISQTELARRLNISRQYMSKIENGERTGTAKLLKKIASILAVDFDELA
jgi:DNA-binding XRE family transcriptional regulator